jgi:hypothetical protein
LDSLEKITIFGTSSTTPAINHLAEAHKLNADGQSQYSLYRSVFRVERDKLVQIVFLFNQFNFEDQNLTLKPQKASFPESSDVVDQDVI